MQQKGFTLIELLVAISILAIVSTIGLVTYSNAQISGRDAKRKIELRNLRIALELYYQKNHTYPAVSINSSSASWTDNGLFNPPSDYISPGVPVDPKNASPYLYSYSSDGSTYTLCANLENDNDHDHNAVCSGSYDFGLTSP